MRAGVALDVAQDWVVITLPLKALADQPTADGNWKSSRMVVVRTEVLARVEEALNDDKLTGFVSSVVEQTRRGKDGDVHVVTMVLVPSAESVHPTEGWG